MSHITRALIHGIEQTITVFIYTYHSAVQTFCLVSLKSLKSRMEATLFLEGPPKLSEVKCPILKENGAGIGLKVLYEGK